MTTPIEVISTIKPKNNGSFPVVEDSDIKGGYHVVQNISDRDNISQNNLKDGMIVFVVNDNKYYSRVSGNWMPLNLNFSFIYTANDVPTGSTVALSADVNFYLNSGKAASLKANFVVFDSGSLSAYYDYNLLVKNDGSGLAVVGTPNLINHFVEIVMGADPAHTFSFSGSGNDLIINVTNNETTNSANIKGVITYNII